MTGAAAGRPWLALYDEGNPPEIEPEFSNCLELWRWNATRFPDRPMMHYFETTLTVAEVDRMSDGLAVALVGLGLQRGDRVAVYLQNIPQFVVAQLATWKAGGVMVSVNPMRARELDVMLTDSGASVLVCLESLYGDVAGAVVLGTAVRTVITTSELDLAGATTSPLLAGVTRQRHDGTLDLLDLVARHDGARPDPVSTESGDVAFLSYTSGTTGPPKGAMNTHRNVVFNAQTTGSGYTSPRTTCAWPSPPCSTSPASWPTSRCRCWSPCRWCCPIGSIPPRCWR